MARRLFLCGRVAALATLTSFAVPGCANSTPRAGDAAAARADVPDNYVGPAGTAQLREMEARRSRAQTPDRRPTDFPAIGSTIKVDLAPAGSEPTGHAATVNGRLVALSDKWAQLR